MGIKRLFLLCFVAHLQAMSVVCEHGQIYEALDLNHIEPLSCATYADLIPTTQEDNAVLIARLVSSAHEKNYVHYVDAHLLHTALFHGGTPSPENAPKVLFNPVNNLPLTENITYFALYADHADYVGTLTDVYTQTPAGEFIHAFLDAHHVGTDTERAYAYYALAYCYHIGTGVEQDMYRALHWYTQALAHADTQMQPQLWYALGSIYEASTDIPDHAIHALTYYTKVADNDSDAYSKGAAFYALGNWYATYNHNGAKARDYYTHACACADATIQTQAFIALADMYRNGTILPKDYAQASAYYTQALSYTPDASLTTYIQYAHATLYYQGGYGIEKDYQKARTLFETVARGGDTVYKVATELALGELYRVGGYGITADVSRAHALYDSVLATATADTQHRYMAQFGLAEVYRVSNERVKAQALYKELLTQCTDGNCMQPILYNGLASLYCFSCDQIAADYTRAHAYYTHAFEQKTNLQSRAVAANGLATLYYHGVPSVTQDIPKAVEYYQYLTTQQDDLVLQAHANHVLGTLYCYGSRTIARDLEQAITYLQQAAEQKVNLQVQEKARTTLQEIHEQSVQMASRLGKVLHRS